MKSLVIGTLIGLVTTFPAIAHQNRCAPAADLNQLLFDRFGEKGGEAIVTPDGKAFAQMYTNEETGSWTLVMSNGFVMCVQAGSDHPPLEGEKS